MAQHTLSVLVENSPGVLARVASLFSRRGYNIDSLAVGPTENPEVSRMTIVLNLEGHALDQVSAQLFKLVNVIGIQEMTSTNSRQRELLMVKVSNSTSRGEIESLVKKYNGQIVEESSNSLVIEAVGTSKDLATLLTELNKFGVKELVQSGLIAIETSDTTLVERTLQETGLASSESQSQTEDYQN
ncbi:MAG: acetolactate synthase small subunit [Candidatus Nanopelagicaceae bacterium]|nr:acetolactate synthase small subunit [Candidatus Nanopelagicaceae bacterium]